MLYEISWYIPKRVIHIHILAELDLKTLEEMSHIVFEMLEEGLPPIHILLDDAKGGRPPISLKELQARLGIVKHPSIAWVIGIGEGDSVAKFLVPLFMKVMTVNYTRVPNIESALVFLNKTDMSLQNMP